MPQTLREEILAMNERISKEFIKTIPDRREHRDNHPTEWAVTMCMDGRVNIRGACNLPIGLFAPYRNLGGRYDPRWPKMRDSLQEWWWYAHLHLVKAGLLITYHYCNGDEKLGCRGFDNDSNAAIEFMLRFRNQIERSFPGMIWPVVLGVDTNTDALTVHGEHGTIMDILRVDDPTPSYFTWRLGQMLPSTPEQVRADLVPFLIGNAAHIKELRESGGRPHEELTHAERGIAFGQGFDWIDIENRFLIVGPCDPALDDAIVTAAEIIQENRRAGTAKGEGGILLVSTPYRKRWERPSAAEHSLYMAEFGLASIRRRLPEMADYFHPLVGVLDLSTRRFEEIKFTF